MTDFIPTLTLRQQDGEGNIHETVHQLSPYCRWEEWLLDNGSSRVRLDFITATKQDISPELANGLPSHVMAKLAINETMARATGEAHPDQFVAPHAVPGVT